MNVSTKIFSSSSYLFYSYTCFKHLSTIFMVFKIIPGGVAFDLYNGDCFDSVVFF